MQGSPILHQVPPNCWQIYLLHTWNERVCHPVRSGQPVTSVLEHCLSFPYMHPLLGRAVASPGLIANEENTREEGSPSSLSNSTCLLFSPGRLLRSPQVPASTPVCRHQTSPRSSSMRSGTEADEGTGGATHPSKLSLPAGS